MVGYSPFLRPGGGARKTRSHPHHQCVGAFWEIYKFGRYCHYSNFHSSYQSAPYVDYVSCESAMSVGAYAKMVVAASYCQAADEMTVHTPDKHTRVVGYLVYLCSALDGGRARIHLSVPPNRVPCGFLGESDCSDHWAVCCVPCRLLDHQVYPHLVFVWLYHVGCESCIL